MGQRAVELPSLCSMGSKYVEPKKACLAWLIMYRAIWTQKKAKQLGIGDGKCARCGLKEEDIHIFLQCKSIAPWIASINKYVFSGGRGWLSWKHLLIGESIGCSNESWMMIRTKILWFLWIERLAMIFQESIWNVCSLQHYLVNARERFYTKRHKYLSIWIQTLQKRIEMKLISSPT